MKELRKLIGTYNMLIHDHKYPIDMTTKEQHRLEGYDAALIRVVNDLQGVLKEIKMSSSELTVEQKLKYTE